MKYIKLISFNGSLYPLLSLTSFLSMFHSPLNHPHGFSMHLACGSPYDSIKQCELHKEEKKKLEGKRQSEKNRMWRVLEGMIKT